MGVRFGLYVRGGSPVKVEKRAKRQCLFKRCRSPRPNTYAAALARQPGPAMVRKTSEPLAENEASILPLWCSRLQGVAHPLRHASTKTDIQKAVG
jgi:hypothetical protein